VCSTYTAPSISGDDNNNNNNNTDNVRVNLTLRRVRVTIVAVEKKEVFKKPVGMSVAVVTQPAKGMRHIVLSSVAYSDCAIFFSHYTIKGGGRDSSVGIATGYGLEGPGIESRWGRDFSHTSRPALGSTQPPVQWVPGLSRG
jgi:hypothetical protein